jgi:hypothetical protein
MHVFRPEAPALASRRIAAADDATEYLERLTQLAIEVNGIVKDDERLAQKFAELVSASPSSLFAALVMTILARRDADVYVERLNEQLQRIPTPDGKRWQFLTVHARGY